ncbi:cytochrome P450 [Aquihabitans sp. G128]|uniref:cytochrome P450 n=1 Tax=Aquihabitans sp. G128 TaxID=2849779 RepID=UPI001C24E043|nr:cytochrome P450 [Aquihabitans sp. G128]QXC60110.1 cytochrome P450 [Aquihabitans sp. G128]
MPPVAGPRLPWVGAAPGLLRDPTGWFTRQRARHGDTFVVDALAHRFFCVFGPVGVASLYAVPEREASFGLATYTMIRTKVPDELFGDIRNPPHKLFGGQRVEGYLANLEQAMAAELDVLGERGTFDAFGECRRIGHRLGLASWAGHEAASPAHIEPLIDALDRLDTSESFVHPLRTVATVATGHARERRAMAEIEAILATVLAERRRRPDARPGDFLDQIDESFADVDQPRHDQLVARDVIVLHLGSQSNLFAALAWTLVNLLQDPDALDAVRAGDDALLDRFAYESIRVAQRSITMRQVLRPLTFTTDQGDFDLRPGTLITTMLSTLNTTVDPRLATFDADHYDGRRLALADELPAKELVSTFGHGTHTCPAQRFSISAIRTAVRALVDRYDLVAGFDRPGPLTRQIGGVARADRPTPVHFRPRG